MYRDVLEIGRLKSDNDRGVNSTRVSNFTVGP